MPITAALIGGGASLLGGIMGGNSAKSAARTQSEAQTEAARIAAEESRFRPVAITSGFGKSRFTMGEDGRLSEAGYELTPEMQSLRDQLIGQAGQEGMGFAKQGLGAAQGLFGMGQSLMPTSAQYGASPESQEYVNMLRQQAAMAAPTGFNRQATQGVQDYGQGLLGLAGQITPQSYDTQQAAQRYFQQQQDVLRPEREQALSGLQNRLTQTGTQGLGVAQAGGGQANPLMQAFANAQSQQDRVLAGQSEQIARQNLKEDIDLGTGLGGRGINAIEQSAQQNLMNSMDLGRFAAGQMGLGMEASQNALNFDRSRVLGDIQAAQGMFGGALNLASGSYSPLQTQIGQAQGIEALGQGTLDMGAQLGGRNANTAGADALMRGGMASAGSMAAANAYNPMASALQGVGSNQQFNQALAGMFNQQQPTAHRFGTYPGSQQTQMLAAQDAWFR
jgi:hypothetical protein